MSYEPRIPPTRLEDVLRWADDEHRRIAQALGGDGVLALTDGATIGIDCTRSDNFRVVLGGNRTLSNPTRPRNGQVIRMRIKQDGTGSRTLTWGSKFKFPGGAPTLTATAGALDLVTAQYDAADDTWACVMSNNLS